MSAKLEKVTFDVIRRTAAPFASRPPLGEIPAASSRHPLGPKTEKITFDVIRRTAAPFVFQPSVSELLSPSATT